MASGSGESGDGDIGFQIAPMVDVVFVLLLFFMASAGSQVVERHLNINLPSGQKGEGAEEALTPFIVKVLENGSIEGNGQPFDTPNDKNLLQLRAKFKELIERFSDKNPVIVNPEDQAKHERVMDVLNAAAASGIKNLTFM